MAAKQAPGWKSKTLLALAVLSCLASGPVANAAAPSSAVKAESEKQVVEAFLSALSGKETAKRKKNPFADAALTMDFDEMARRAFGDSGWKTFNPEEQKEVTALFKRLMQIRYFPRWQRIFQEGKYEVTAVTRQASDSLVAGKLNLDGKKNDLTFRLTKASDGYKLISMSIKDKDLLERTSLRLKRGLKQRGAQGLIAHLRKKTAEAPKKVTDSLPMEDLVSGGK